MARAAATLDQAARTATDRGLDDAADRARALIEIAEAYRRIAAAAAANLQLAPEEPR